MAEMDDLSDDVVRRIRDGAGRGGALRSEIVHSLCAEILRQREENAEWDRKWHGVLANDPARRYTLDPNHPLDRRLLEFAEAMKAKFVVREAKHPGESSVTHRDFDWARSLDFEAIWVHAIEEIQEWRGEHIPARRAGEAIDVANMMFLNRQIFLEREAKRLERSV